MLLTQKLRHTGKVSNLLTSKDKKVAQQLADFLVQIEDERKVIEKEENEAEDQ